MNVLFIGGGNMADALIGGMLKSGFAASQLRVVEVDGAARRRLFEKYRVECLAEVRGAARPGEVVVFAVKPQQMQEAARFSGLKPNANLAVSIAAGITLSSLGGWLGGPNGSHTKLVRAMPNTPALIGAGGQRAVCAAWRERSRAQAGRSDPRRCRRHGGGSRTKR